MIAALAVVAAMSFPFTVPDGACGGYAWRVTDPTGYVLETSPFGTLEAPGTRTSASYPVPLDGIPRAYCLLAFNCDRTRWAVGNPVILAAGVAAGRLYGAYFDPATGAWCKRPLAGYGTLRVGWALPWVEKPAPLEVRLSSVPDPQGCP